MENTLEKIRVPLESVTLDQIQPFEEKSITTMVAICSISGEIFPPQAFTMLPITRIELTETKSSSKNISLPHHPVPGSILSMRYENETRGIILRVKKSTHFRNSITIDMSIADKNVNFRLSKSTIHMCGVRSFDQIRETVSLLFDHLKHIQGELNYLGENPTATAECLKFIRNNIRSKDVSGVKVLSMEGGGRNYENIDQRIMSFMLKNLSDHNSANSFLTELQWILQQSNIYTGNLEILRIDTSMINKNYDIGFEINRRALAKYIRFIDNFYLDYDNAITHSVKIMLPFEIPKHANIRRKKKKDGFPHHTFMVYKSGCVTQSGPSLELMKDAYYRFFKAIYSLRYLIEKPKAGMTGTGITGNGRVRIRIVGKESLDSIDVLEGQGHPLAQASESGSEGRGPPLAQTSGNEVTESEKSLRIDDITESE